MPEIDVDYGWVLTRAKEHYAAIDKALEQIDAKAAVILNYFGGGAGVLAFVTTLGASSGTISIYVASAMIPSFVASIGAIIYASWSRGPEELFAGPGPDGCVTYIEHYRGIGPVESASRRAEYAMAGVWNTVCDDNSQVMQKKSHRLRRALQWKSVAIGLLLLPLFVAIIEKTVTSSPEPKPMRVLVEQPVK